MSRNIWIVLLVLVGVVVLYECSGEEGVSGPAPDVTLTDIRGRTIALKDLRGKVVVVNFWSTRCPPCRKEIPSFKKLHQACAKDGLVIIGVAVGPAKELPPFVEKHAVPYAIVTRDAMRTVGAFGVRGRFGIPLTFVIDRSGQLREKLVGYRSYDALVEVLEPLLAEQPAPQPPPAEG